MRYYKQQQGFSCGPACARMMLHEFGIEETEEHIIKILEAASHKGTPRENWEKLAKHYNLDIVAHEPGSLEQIVELKAQGWQITLLILADVPHYVGFLGLKDGRVYMHDPWDTPNYSLLVRNFIKKWEVTPEKWGRDSIYNSKHWFVAVKPKSTEQSQSSFLMQTRSSHEK